MLEVCSSKCWWDGPLARWVTGERQARLGQQTTKLCECIMTSNNFSFKAICKVQALDCVELWATTSNSVLCWCAGSEAEEAAIPTCKSSRWHRLYSALPVLCGFKLCRYSCPIINEYDSSDRFSVYIFSVTTVFRYKSTVWNKIILSPTKMSCK